MKIRIYNIGSIVTWSHKNNEVQSLTNVEILIDGDKISDISHKILDADQEIYAEGALIIPGFIDSHTHPIFIGNRSNEFALRVEGKTYDEIARSGGGILASINKVRNASEEQLIEESYGKINLFLSHGTTTIEAKSGYGLTLKDEVKSLRVIKKLNENGKLEIIPTFLGAHAVPPEFQNNHKKYVDLICDKMIPEVADRKLAIFCDVFCEEGYFSVKQSEKILLKGIDCGLIPRLHADEFIDSGAAGLAADIKAVSADHLMFASDDNLKKMADANVISVVLPGTTFFLGKNEYVNAEKILKFGGDIAIASDYNPGSCLVQSMPFIMFLSNLYCNLSIDLSFKACTYNAAKVLKKETEIGLVKEGFKADLLIWKADKIANIPYCFDNADSSILNIIKNGTILK